MDKVLLSPLLEGDFGWTRTTGASLLEGDFSTLQNSSNNGIVIYRGTPTPEDIDWDTPVGGRIGSGNVTINFTHTNEVDYWYGARQISCFGRIDQGTNAACFFKLDSDSAVDYVRPDHITGLTATPKAGGIIKLQWIHTKFDGTKPVKFNVYSDGGSCVATLGNSGSRTLVGTVTYVSGISQYSLSTGALTNGQEYWFMVQAEDTDGVEDHYNLTIPAMADSSGHAILTGLSIGATY